MEKRKLAEEIVSFCCRYSLINNLEYTSASVQNVEGQLENCWFVEHLIHLFITKAKYKKGLDTKKLKELVLELEKIRLDLEYDE